jgi:hypothetical protein
MELEIVIVNRTNRDEQVKVFDWPEGIPLAIPEVGDQVKFWSGPYGTVVSRSFNYSDSIVVELRAEF